MYNCTYTRYISRGSDYRSALWGRTFSRLTIWKTIYRIKDELGVETNQEIVVWAVRNGLLDEPPEVRSGTQHRFDSESNHGRGL